MGAVRSFLSKSLHHTVIIYQAPFLLGGFTSGKRRGPCPIALTPWQQDQQARQSWRCPKLPPSGRGARGYVHPWAQGMEAVGKVGLRENPG